MTSETQPVAFKRGMPKEQKNGFYGIEKQLLDNPQEPIVAIVTFRVDEIIDKELSGERYPIVEIDHLEPIFGVQAIEAKDLQAAAYKLRTGANTLPIDDEPAPGSAGASEADGQVREPMWGDGADEPKSIPTDDELEAEGYNLTTDGPDEPTAA